jgi:hypothetical protein
VIRITLEEVAKKLRRVDPSAVVKGELFFPLHPSTRRDVVMVQSVSKKGQTNETSAIHLFWKSNDGTIRHLTAAVSAVRRYELFVSAGGLKIIGEHNGNRSNQMYASFFAFSTFSPHSTIPFELSGVLAEGSTRWKWRNPTKIIRL